MRDLLPHINENGISGEIADTGSYDMTKGSKVKPSKPAGKPKPAKTLGGGGGHGSSPS